MNRIHCQHHSQVVIPKDDETKKALTKAIDTNLLFRYLDAEEKQLSASCQS